MPQDTILFSSTASAYVILDDFEVGNDAGDDATAAALNGQISLGNDISPTSLQSGEFERPKGSYEGKDILVGTAKSDTFIVDTVVETGFNMADVIYGFEKTDGDKIQLSPKTEAGVPVAFTGAIKFDKNKDWNGDKKQDTIIYVEENGQKKTLAVLNGVSVELDSGDFLGGENITVTEESLLPGLTDIL